MSEYKSNKLVNYEIWTYAFSVICTKMLHAQQQHHGNRWALTGAAIKSSNGFAGVENNCWVAGTGSWDGKERGRCKETVTESEENRSCETETDRQKKTIKAMTWHWKFESLTDTAQLICEVICKEWFCSATQLASGSLLILFLKPKLWQCDQKQHQINLSIR